MLAKTLTARIKLDLIFAADLWPIHVDEADLEDAILNLSINAMHTMKTQGQLSISTQNKLIDTSIADKLQLVSGDDVMLSFKDSGCGMDQFKYLLNETKELNLIFYFLVATKITNKIKT